MLMLMMVTTVTLRRGFFRSAAPRAVVPRHGH